MAFDAVGKLVDVFETKQISDRFSKREFVLELADGKYPQTVLFQATGDRCSMLDDFNIGDEIRVTFNLRGRAWTSPKGETRYFNTLDVWKLEATGPAKKQDRQPDLPGGGASGGQAGIDDDLPFVSCDAASDPSPVPRILR